MSFTQNSRPRLHYQLLGEGSQFVVFLHGLVMDNLSSWFFTMANPVSKICRVLLYDLRGHGYSDVPKVGYSVDDHVEDLNQLLQDLGLAEHRVHLVGNSFGGLVALNFAHRYPNQVAGLAVVDGQINSDAWKNEMIQSLSAQGIERDRLISNNFQSWQGRNSKRKSHRLAEHAEKLVCRTTLLSDLKDSKVLSDDDLVAMNVRTLGIYGADSDILHVAKHLKSHLPHMDLQVLSRCTHSILWEKTDEVKSLLIQWLEKERV